VYFVEERLELGVDRGPLVHSRREKFAEDLLRAMREGHLLLQGKVSRYAAVNAAWNAARIYCHATLHTFMCWCAIASAWLRYDRIMSVLFTMPAAVPSTRFAGDPWAHVS
jgi:hypothetical protein